MGDDGQRTLDRAFDVLEDETPDRVSRAIHWLRSPKSRWVRFPLGILFVAAGFLGPVLPVVGLELVPFGLLLLAQDIPFLKKPVGKAMLWLEHKWIAFRERRRKRRARRHADEAMRRDYRSTPHTPGA